MQKVRQLWERRIRGQACCTWEDASACAVAPQRSVCPACDAPTACTHARRLLHMTAANRLPGSPPQGGPLSAVSRAAQKTVGLLIRPWETAELLKPGNSARHLHKPCRLHLKASTQHVGTWLVLMSARCTIQ